MSGSKAHGLILQDRDRQLLYELTTMRVVDREQAKLVCGFSSNSRANKRLLALTRAGFLRRFFTGTIAGGRRAIYTQTAKGANAAQTPNRQIRRSSNLTVIGDALLEHQQGINSVFLTVKYLPLPNGITFERWMTFRAPLSDVARLVPDGYFDVHSTDRLFPNFVEVDRGTEPLRIWRQKVEAYLQLALTGEFARLFGQAQFRVLVLTHSLRRMQHLRRTTASSTNKIFWFATFDFINRDGFWSHVWLRPEGDRKHSFV